MKPKKRVAKTFYEKRAISVPKQEWWPTNGAELRELINDSDTPLMLIGDGQHLRSSVIGERGFDVVRTTKCTQILSVDRESRLARVEAGIRWGDLQAELLERGLTLERCHLYPSSSTIGGLLGRYQHYGKELWNGDLRSACIAISTASPNSGDYRYLAAPRKATGPDHRYAFIGAEGLVGAILDTTLIAWKPADARLFQWKVASIEEAVENYTNIIDLGVRTSWTHLADNVLSIAVHGPERVLRGVERELKASVPGAEIGSRQAVSEHREALEKAHPDRRELSSSKRTIAATFSLEHLASALSSLDDGVENVEVWDWSRRQARAFIRFSRGRAAVELPTDARALALTARPVMDDEAIHWPSWAQTLKTKLDPQRRLATGP